MEQGIKSYQSIYENLLEVWCTGWSSMVPQRLSWYQVEGGEEEADNSNDEVVLKHICWTISGFVHIDLINTFNMRIPYSLFTLQVI